MTIDWNAVNQSVIGAVITAIVIGVWKAGVIEGILNFNKELTFSFDGYWISNFKSHLGEYENIDVIYIKHSADKANIKGWSYSGKSGKLRNFSAIGLIKGHSIAAVYAVTDQSSLQSGVFALRASQDVAGQPSLRGFYAEFDYREPSGAIAHSPEGYNFRALDLGYVNLARLRFGLKPFANFKQIEEFEVG